MFTKLLTGAIAAGAISIPLAGVATAQPSTGTHGDVSVSVNGNPVKTSTNTSTIAGTTQSTGGAANVAIARDSSTAYAINGSGNRATATNNSYAVASGGNNNTATATNNSIAEAIQGNNNTATATNYGYAVAQEGNNNTATATNGTASGMSFAQAGGLPPIFPGGQPILSNNNTAIATCGGSATAFGGPDGSATVTDNGSCG